MKSINYEKQVRAGRMGRATLWLSFIAMLGLAGCNSNEYSSAGGVDTATNATSSTLLIDNTLIENARFANFTATTLQVTVAQILASEQVTFSGNRTYMKLALSDGEILFLGEVNRDQSLALLVDLPLGTRTLRYEIFSDIPLDNTVFGEIVL